MTDCAKVLRVLHKNGIDARKLFPGNDGVIRHRDDLLSLEAYEYLIKTCR